jgi:hypothetical protein
VQVVVHFNDETYEIAPLFTEEAAAVVCDAVTGESRHCRLCGCRRSVSGML